MTPSLSIPLPASGCVLTFGAWNMSAGTLGLRAQPVLLGVCRDKYFFWFLMCNNPAPKTDDPRPHILQVEGFGEQKLQGDYFDTWAVNLHAPKSWTLRCMDNNQV